MSGRCGPPGERLGGGSGTQILAAAHCKSGRNDKRYWKRFHRRWVRRNGKRHLDDAPPSNRYCGYWS